MFFNYIKVAFRHIRKNKVFSFINIFGLALGMAACLLMLMYVYNEKSYDDFHKEKKRIFRIITDWGNEGSKMKFAGSMPAIAPTLKAEVPEVEFAARVRPLAETVITDQNNQRLEEGNVYYADPDIFKILTWKIISGPTAQILSEPFTVVLSEKTAVKYYGNTDPVGANLTINERLYKVAGVMEELPPNTHLNCNILISYSTLEALGQYPEEPWNIWGDDYNYMLLKNNVQSETIRAKLNEFVVKYGGKWFEGRMDLIPQALSKIHWDNESRGDVGLKGNYLYVSLFLTAAILVLLIACFNFMNLSTSRYLERMKEVGIRKVAGANRGQLIIQFLVESVLISLIAVVCGAYIFSLIHKIIYSFLNVKLVLNSSHVITLYGLIAALVLFVGLFAGSYPAFFLSRFRPVDIIKSRIIGDKAKLFSRQVLVVLQYSISIILIVGTISIYSQINFMKNSSLGFEKEDVALLQFPWNNDEVKSKYQVLHDQILNIPGVISVSGAFTVPGINSQFQMSVRKPGASNEDAIGMQALPADYGFLKAMGLQLYSGRDFSREYSLDDAESLIINEAAVKTLALEDPIGKKILIPRGKKNQEMTIIGIVKDFHIKSLHHKISPIIIFLEPNLFGMMAVKVKPENSQQTISAVQTTWQNVLPLTKFNYRYMQDAYFNLYNAEEKTGKLISVFTCLALFVSCLGLFGLASFMASRRRKEIGIRKVMGASTGKMALLLSRQFTRWVLVSNLVAWPLAAYLLSRWLDNFAYRIKLGPLPFLLSGAAVFLIAILTVSYQAVKAAATDPVKSLRYE